MAEKLGQGVFRSFVGSSVSTSLRLRSWEHVSVTLVIESVCVAVRVARRKKEHRLELRRGSHRYISCKYFRSRLLT